MAGIHSFGVYLPRRRMARAAIAEAHAWAFPSLRAQAKGERTLCSWDEDAITMAVEAGRDCLPVEDRRAVGALTLASTTLPYADASNAVFVSAALRLETHVTTAELGGSMRAGLSALIAACQSSSEAKQLIIATEKRTAKPGSVQEMHAGCGAAAIQVGPGDGAIARFLGAQTVSVPFVDHFRKSGATFDYGWEERWIRDEGVAKLVPGACRRLLQRLGIGPEKLSYVGLSGGPAKSDVVIAKLLDVPREKLLPDLATTVGDIGAAHSLLQLCAALERAQPGEIILLVAFGQGCEVAAFEMGGGASSRARRGLAGNLARRVEERAYLKMLSNDGLLEMDWGMRAETDHKTPLTQLYRAADQVFGFVGGRCAACQTVQFPRLPTCVNCGAVDSQHSHGLADEPAKIATYTADWLQYCPSPPLYMGLVQFQNRARLLMEIVDVGASGIEVGTPLTMVFRKKERDRLRGWDRYFWKATPVD